MSTTAPAPAELLTENVLVLAAHRLEAIRRALKCTDPADATECQDTADAFREWSADTWAALEGHVRRHVGTLAPLPTLPNGTAASVWAAFDVHHFPWRQEAEALELAIRGMPFADETCFLEPEWLTAGVELAIGRWWERTETAMRDFAVARFVGPGTIP